MSDTDIGSVRASAKLDATSFLAGITAITTGATGLGAVLNELAAKTGASLGAMSDAVAAESAKINSAMGAMQKNAHERMEQPLAKFAKSASNYMLIAGGAITTGLGMAVKSYEDYNKTLSDVAGNTNMTTDEMNAMSDVVQKLATGSGAPMDQLAKGYMHIVNFGYRGADATNILTAAMKSAESTGGDTGAVANLLAGVMHEFGIKTSGAATAMDILHDAAANGNMTLEELVESAGPAMSAAANLGVSLTDVAASMSALTRHGYNAADAATQLKGMLDHIATPAINAKRELEALSKKSGIDLVSAFSVAGLRAHGLVGVLDLLKEAAKKSGVDVSEAVMKTIPARRGGHGALALLGTGSKDLRRELERLNDIIEGKLHPTEDQFAREQGTLAAQMKKVHEQILALGQGMGQALAPAVMDVTKDLNDQLAAFNKLPDSVKSTTVEIGAITAAALIAVNGLAKLSVAIDMLRASAAAPIVFSVSMVAGVAGFNILKDYEEWAGTQATYKKARETDAKTQQLGVALAAEKARNYDLEQLRHPEKLSKLDLKMDKEDLAYQQKYLHDHGFFANSPTHGLPKSAFIDFGHGHGAVNQHPVHHIAKHIEDAVKTALAGSSGGKGHADELKRKHEEALRKHEEALRTMEQSTEAAQESLMSRFQLEIHDAWKTFNQRIRDGVSKALAMEELRHTLAGVAKEKAQAAADAAKKAQADLTAKFQPLTDSMSSFADDIASGMQAVISWQQNRQQETDAAKRSLMTEVQKERADAKALFDERIAAGVKRSLAQQEYDHTIEAIQAEQSKKLADAFAQSMAAQARAMDASMRQLAEQAQKTAQMRFQNLQYLHPFEAQRQIALENYQKELQNGVNPDDAKAEYDQRMSAINRREKAQQPATIMQSLAMQLATSLRDNLQTAFEKLFGTHKSTFGGFLTSMFSQFFKNMIGDAMSKIGNGMGGGGGLLGGVLNAGLGAFGFDDASNDAAARRYGFDFASNFLAGQSQYVTQHAMIGSKTLSQQRHTIIAVNMTGDHHYHSDMDARKIGQSIAWHASEMLRTRL